MSSAKYSLLNESWSMLLTYLTAIVLVFVLTFHLLLHSPLTGSSFEDTLTFGYATGNLVYFKLVFGLLLLAAVLHGFNGVRAVMLELFHPSKRSWLLNVLVVVLVAFFLALGSYTLLVV
jgi:succinate dehydrogenase hydrophobic anchor subunit